MEATLNGLWTFLQSLHLTASNKEWLADRLIEEAKNEKKDATYADLVYELCGSLKDERSPKQVTEDIRAARHYDETRNILPLSNE